MRIHKPENVQTKIRFELRVQRKVFGRWKPAATNACNVIVGYLSAYPYNYIIINTAIMGVLKLSI